MHASGCPCGRHCQGPKVIGGLSGQVNASAPEVAAPAELPKY